MISDGEDERRVISATLIKYVIQDLDSHADNLFLILDMHPQLSDNRDGEYH